MLKALLLTSLIVSTASVSAASRVEVPGHLNIEDFSGRTYSAIDSVDYVKITLKQELIISAIQGQYVSGADGYACMLSNLENKKVVLKKGLVLESQSEFRNAHIDWSNRDDGKEIVLSDAKKNEYLLQCGSIQKGHMAYYSGEGSSDYNLDMKACATHHGVISDVITGPAIYREATMAEKIQDLALGTVRYTNGMEPVSRSKGYYFKCSHRPHSVNDVQTLFSNAGMDLKLFTTK